MGKFVKVGLSTTALKKTYFFIVAQMSDSLDIHRWAKTTNSRDNRTHTDRPVAANGLFGLAGLRKVSLKTAH